MSKISNLVPFKKGNDLRRNLNGRPTGSKNFKTVISNFLGSYTELYKGEISHFKNCQIDGYEKIVLTLLKKAMIDGELKSMKEIMCRLDGKPEQTFTLNNSDPVYDLSVLDMKELKQFSKLMRKIQIKD